MLNKLTDVLKDTQQQQQIKKIKKILYSTLKLLQG